jgi:shikimate dehydrogenase
MISLGLIGWPVAHSASPAMFRAGLRAAGLEGEYLLWPTPPGALSARVEELRAAGAGANVTAPHKVEALSLADAAEAEAKEAGAANVLYHQGGRLIAANTDGVGLARSLTEAGCEVSGRRVVFIGAGGAARTAGRALVKLGAELTLVGRELARVSAVALDIGARAAPLTREAMEPLLASCDLLIQATPATLGAGDRERGMGNGAREEQGSPGGQGAGSPGHSPFPAPHSLLLELLPLERLPSGSFVCDLVYRPLETVLLAAARGLGFRVVDGAGMLLYQGAEAFQRFTGRPAPLPEMREALRRELGG